jgi:hypothetical protein
MTEILQSTCGRYHDLLAANLQSRLSAVVEADVLAELEVRTEAQHRQVVDDYNLPWQLEGAGVSAACMQTDHRWCSDCAVPTAAVKTMRTLCLWTKLLLCHSALQGQDYLCR